MCVKVAESKLGGAEGYKLFCHMARGKGWKKYQLRLRGGGGGRKNLLTWMKMYPNHPPRHPADNK